MDSKALKRRSWIKNIAIIFLSVMLFLTFFSNTIMNFSLPEVSAQYPSSGSITTRVRKTGNVAATEDYEVVLDETRNLLGVEIKKGDKVAIGDLLFILEEGDSKEVETAIKTYDDKKVEYEEAVLKLDKEYTDLVKAVNDAGTELSKLRSKQNASSDENKKQLEKEKSDLEWEKSILDKQNPNVKYDYSVLGKSNNTVLADADKLYESAKADFEISKTALENADRDLENADTNKYNAQKALDKATSELSEYEKNLGTTTITEESLIKQRRDIQSLENDRSRSLSELDSLYNNWNNAISTANNALINAYNAYQDAKEKLEKEEIDQATFDAIKSTYEKASVDFDSVQSTRPAEILAKEHSIEDLAFQIKNAKEDLARNEAKYNEIEGNSGELQRYKNAKDSAQQNLDSASEAYNDAEKSQKTASDNRTKAETLMNGYLSLKLDTEARILDEKIRDIDNELKDIGTTVTDEEIEAAEKKLSDAQQALNNAKNADDKTSDVESLRVENIKKELDRLADEVERLHKNNVGTEVRAKVAGMISEINYVAGNEIKAGSIIAKIQIIEKGYYVEFDVTNEEAARIRPGEIASIQYYWGPTIEAIVESIKNSTSNPGKAKTVRINISGEIEVGRQLTFNLGERGQNYDTVVPKSAIREDSNGKFILTVVSKSTPLGNRYTAVRVDVTVLAEDDTNCAISLGLYGSEFIITTSTKPIKDGDQVRLVDR